MNKYNRFLEVLQACIIIRGGAKIGIDKLLTMPLMELLKLIYPNGIYLEAKRLDVFHSFPMGWWSCLAFSITQHVDVDIQWALSCDTRVKLTY